MATLYVENVPEELYEGLRARAQENRKSITAEVLALLEANVPTPRELSQRKAFLKSVVKIRGRHATSEEPFPSSEEMQREDRAR